MRGEATGESRWGGSRTSLHKFLVASSCPTFFMGLLGCRIFYNAPNLEGLFIFIFVTVQVCRDRELSIMIENPCRAPTSCRDNPGRARSAFSSACPGLGVRALRELSPRAQALL